MLRPQISFRTICRDWHLVRATVTKEPWACPLAVGGSLGMARAIGLTGLAALRSGAGLVSVACPISILSIVASFEPCYTTIPLLDLNGLVNPQGDTWPGKSACHRIGNWARHGNQS